MKDFPIHPPSLLPPNKVRLTLKINFKTQKDMIEKKQKKNNKIIFFIFFLTCSTKIVWLFFVIFPFTCSLNFSYIFLRTLNH